MAVITHHTSEAPQVLPAWRKLLVTIHVLVTVGLFGADLVLLALGITRVLRLPFGTRRRDAVVILRRRLQPGQRELVREVRRLGAGSG